MNQGLQKVLGKYRRLLLFGMEMKERLVQTSIFDLSAQLSYYFLLSMFPFLLVVLTASSFLPISSDDILKFIQPYAPAKTYSFIEYNLRMMLDHDHGSVFSLSLIATVYLASLSFQSIITILDIAYHTVTKRPFYKQLILGVVLMLGLFVSILLTLLLSVFGELIYHRVLQWFGLKLALGHTWEWIRWGMTSLVIFLVSMVLYKVIPIARVAFREAIPGAIFTTFGWQISSLVFALYVSWNDYFYYYGDIGGVIILLGWFYWSSLVLILGAFINASLQEVADINEK